MALQIPISDGMGAPLFPRLPRYTARMLKKDLDAARGMDQGGCHGRRTRRPAAVRLPAVPRRQRPIRGLPRDAAHLHFGHRGGWGIGQGSPRVGPAFVASPDHRQVLPYAATESAGGPGCPARPAAQGARGNRLAGPAGDGNGFLPASKSPAVVSKSPAVQPPNGAGNCESSRMPGGLRRRGNGRR
jgi:hypothetical protein